MVKSIFFPDIWIKICVSYHQYGDHEIKYFFKYRSWDQTILEIKIKRSSKSQNSDHQIKIKCDYGSWDQSFYSLRIKKLRYADHWIKKKLRSKSWDQKFSRIKTIRSIFFMILGCWIKRSQIILIKGLLFLIHLVCKLSNLAMKVKIPTKTIKIKIMRSKIFKDQDRKIIFFMMLRS